MHEMLHGRTQRGFMVFIDQIFNVMLTWNTAHLLFNAGCSVNVSDSDTNENSSPLEREVVVVLW